MDAERKNKENIALFPGMAGLTRDMVERMKAEGTKLLSVDIMVTQKCNFSCVYCYAECSPRQITQLTMRQAREIVKSCADLGVRIINMQGGEPLIWQPADWKERTPDAFFSLVQFAKDLFKSRGLPLDIVSFTDVAVIDARRAGALAELGVALCCKMDSLEEEVQDALLGVKGGARRIKEGFERLKDVGYGRKDMPPLSTNTVVTALNYSGVEDVFRWSRGNNFRPFVIPVHVHGQAKLNSSIMLSGKSSKGTLNAGDIRKLFERLAEIDGKEFGIHWKAESPWVENKACSRHLGGIHIRADGLVLPCSEAPDFWSLGNIRSDSLADIIVSDKVKKFRDIYSQLHEGSKCSPRNCRLSREKLCYGCRTRAYDDSGFGEDGRFDVNGLDPQAFFSGDPACWHNK